MWTIFGKFLKYEISITFFMVDQAKAEAFVGRFLDVFNSGTLCLMISIRHQTRLFDVMARLPASTSQEIASAASLHERYVREWLGAMVTGRIVEYDPATARYTLPPEHAAFLTRSAGIDNLAVFSQYIALMGNVEQQIIDCFHKGGGVPYSAFPRFQELQAEETARVFDARLTSQIVPLADGLAGRLQAGAEALDVGCGLGHAVNLLAQAFPNSRFAGYDISRQAIDAARSEAKQMGLKNARFEVRDISSINEHEKYDLVTAFDTIHDQARPTQVLKEIHGALRVDGTFLMQDIAASSLLHENIGNPLCPALYTFSTMHCMTVSLAYNGEGLGTVWGRQKAEQKLAESGFANVQIKQVAGDILNYYYIAKKI